MHKHYLFIKRLVVFKERLECFKDFHFAGHAGWRRGLALDDSHSERAFVSGNEAFEMLQ